MNFVSKVIFEFQTARHKIYFLSKKVSAWGRIVFYKVKDPKSLYGKKQWTYAEALRAVFSTLNSYMRDETYQKSISEMYRKSKNNKIQIYDHFWNSIIVFFPQIKTLPKKEFDLLRERFNQKMEQVIEWNVDNYN
jgi:hypothetical protein